MNDTKLSSSTTIAKYRELERAQDRRTIAGFILERFTERYLTPIVECPPDKKNGFTVMAISCLLIEALESFRQGWADTDKMSKKAFQLFFGRSAKAGSHLSRFLRSPNSETLDDPLVADFYRGVRCAILHQAETSNGWKIRRDGQLFDADTKTINATAFHHAIGQELLRYCEDLERADWGSQEWCLCRTKMNAVINNCDAARETV